MWLQIGLAIFQAVLLTGAIASNDGSALKVAAICVNSFGIGMCLALALALWADAWKERQRG